MNAEETKAAAAVMMAFDPNKENCEFRTKGGDKWSKCRSPKWDWIIYDYRIAPEPVEVEVWVHQDGRIAGREAMSRDVAEKCGWALRRATIHPETK